MMAAGSFSNMNNGYRLGQEIAAALAGHRSVQCRAAYQRTEREALTGHNFRGEGVRDGKPAERCALSFTP